MDTLASEALPDPPVSDNVTSTNTKKKRLMGEELTKTLSKRKEIDETDEMLDPIEWSFRKIVPIPDKYYWDVIEEDQENEIPRNIKIWHKTIAGLEAVYNWTEKWIAKPVAGGLGLGLTTSRFSYVTETMNQDDWEDSVRIVQERKQNEAEDNIESALPEKRDKE